MKRIFLHPLTLLGSILILLMGGWLLLLPTQLAGKIKQSIETRTGRSFEIAGGAGFRLSPQIGLNLFDVTFSGSSAMAEPVLKSKAVFIPLSFTSLLGGFDKDSALAFIDADVTLAFNAEGHANILIDQNPDASKSDVNAPELSTLSVKIESGTFHYSDARDGIAFVLPQFSGVFDFGDDGNLTATGSTEINDRHANFSGTLKSLARAIEEGSPLDFNLDSEGHIFSFAGRLANLGSLNLAGQGSIETSDAQKFFKWMGVDIKALPSNLKLVLDGPFESQGSTFTFKKSSFQMDQWKAVGDILFSTQGGRKNLVTQLDFETLSVNATGKIGAWSEAPFDVAVLQNLDAQFQISTPQFMIGLANLGAAKIGGLVKNAALTASFQSATMKVSSLKIDASQLPPTLDLALSTVNANAKALIPVLTGQNWLSGPLTMNANLKAHGKSQAEMISTLSGDVVAGVESGSITGNGGKTDFTKFAADIALEDGIASLSNTHLTLADQEAAATGEIDLLRKSFSISAEPVAKQKMLINGTWDAPKISAIAPTMH